MQPQYPHPVSPGWSADGEVLLPSAPTIPAIGFYTAAAQQGPATTTLKVAKWQNSFETAADGFTVQLKKPNFLDQAADAGDPDRFKVYVNDPAVNLKH